MLENKPNGREKGEKGGGGEEEEAFAYRKRKSTEQLEMRYVYKEDKKQTPSRTQRSY